VLSKNIQQLQPVILTAKGLAMEDGKNMAIFILLFVVKP